MAGLSEQTLRRFWAVQEQLGWFAHPVFSRYGNYPAVLRDRVDLNSAREGRDDSRLPYFTKDEIEEIRGNGI